MDHLILEKIAEKLVKDYDYVSHKVNDNGCIINIRKSNEWCLSVSAMLINNELRINGFMMESITIPIADPKMFEKADKHLRACIERSYNIELSKLALQKAKAISP